MYKYIRIITVVYASFLFVKFYNSFYQVWYNFNININANNKSAVAYGSITGFDLINNTVANSQSGATAGLKSIYGMPVVILVVFTALLIALLGYYSNSFMLCITPYLAFIYTKYEFSSMIFKLTNPLYGGSFNKSTGVVDSNVGIVNTLGYIGIAAGVLAFINYRKNSKTEASGIFKNILKFSNSHETA